MLHIGRSVLGYGDPYSKTLVKVPFAFMRGEPSRLFDIHYITVFMDGFPVFLRVRADC
jgi:hypothetical protein